MEPGRTVDTASPSCHHSGDDEEEDVTAAAAMTSSVCHPAGNEEEDKEVAAVVTATVSLECHPSGEEEEEVAVAITSQGGPCGRDEDVVTAVTAEASTTSQGCHPGEEEEVTTVGTSLGCPPLGDDEEVTTAGTAAGTSQGIQPSEEEMTMSATSPARPPVGDEEEMTAAVTSPGCHPSEEEVTAAVTSPVRHHEEEEELTPAVTSPVCHPGEEEEEVTAAVTAAAATSAPGGRRGADEDVAAAGWRARRKHVFVLSEAGKPIYSRHGNEEALAATMGVMMALVSFIQSGGNAIRAICSEDRTLVFEQRGPLLLVSVSRTRQSAAQLRRELAFVHEQILSLLTRGGIARVFARRRGFDLRRLLAGAEAVLDRLLCASDLHLLLNLLGGGAGAGAGEVWTPVCLPRFNPDGYFYAYAARLGEEEEEEGVTLILLSTEREGFYAAAACRRQLEDTLRAQGWLAELAAAVRGGAGYGPSRPGAPELRHFLYKPLEGPEEMQQLPQFTSPELEEPYTSEEEQHRLFDLYHYLHSRVHSPHRPLRLLYHVAEKETLLAWVTSKFELYSCFSPLVTKAGAIAVLTKLLRWLKKEEDWLFIRYPAPFCAAPARPEGPEPEG
ncbi:vacuolar fusion protein MON1 homolog B-like [Pyrgilauda ruficollis]|uniref:vacuolar fusion protein MON1 homolog B-like n=1 Tax=Pyrgilauda ruficollis TaxID=221976 RepID=UPI001B86C4F6|nr:vacuolar fusion protein MON1 homolog B-like [Pyrgilauda ruficollis]